MISLQLINLQNPASHVCETNGCKSSGETHPTNNDCSTNSAIIELLVSNLSNVSLKIPSYTLRLSMA
jgi:hypothetical protein